MTTIKVAQLEKAPLNARRTVSREGIDEMKASIRANGVMQNLVVYPDPQHANDGFRDARYFVAAGSRRLAALQELIAEGTLPDDYAVPCLLVTEERALEMSIAENKVRQAMHPADEFEAFRELIESGQTAEAVAQRFGVKVKHVEQRLKLARVAPELLAAYRAEELTLDALMAFTVTDDHAKQVAVFKGLRHWQLDNASHIRDCLTEAAIASTDKLVLFVGQEAYVAAGGKVRADLFSEVSYFEDADLLHRLAAEKLDAVQQQLQAEGWGWVEVTEDSDWRATSGCSHIEAKATNAPAELVAEKEKLDGEWEKLDERLYGDEELPEEEEEKIGQRQEEIQERLDEVEQQLAEYEAFDPEEMKLAGCYAYVGSRGAMEVTRGLVRKADQKKLTSDGSAAAKKEKPKDAMPDSLRRDLEGYRLQVAQAELASQPDLAFDLLAFNAAVGMLDHGSPYDGPEVSFRRNYPLSFNALGKETLAAKRLEAIEEGLPQKWLKKDDEAERFTEFRKLSQDDKMRLLAFCTAVTLKPKLASLDPDVKRTAYDTTLALMDADVAESWRPTAENYLSRITRDQLMAIAKEIGGEVLLAANRTTKKGPLVEVLHNAFADPEKHGKTPEVIAKLKAWLPAGMSFGTAPVEQPAKKAAKKPSKKAA